MVYDDLTRPSQIHGFDDHDLQLLVRNVGAFQVEQEVLALNVPAVGEIHAEVELDPVLGGRVRCVHEPIQEYRGAFGCVPVQIAFSRNWAV
jgi:hypothetical protein